MYQHIHNHLGHLATTSSIFVPQVQRDPMATRLQENAHISACTEDFPRHYMLYTASMPCLTAINHDTRYISISASATMIWDLFCKIYCVNTIAKT